MELKDKVILLISPQAWGKMFLAKQHYAIELAKAGNEVYFLNPPQAEKIPGHVQVVPSGVHPGLHLIHHTLPFDYRIRFKWMGLFHFLMKFHVRRIRKHINRKLHIIWSFDLGNYYPFRFFDADSFKIYHPVDEPTSPESIAAAKGAQVIFSVTREILDKFVHLQEPRHFMHHGLSEEFAEVEPAPWQTGNTVRVGMSGNWLRPELDFEILKKIISNNTDIRFHLWGSYKTEQTNIGGRKEGAVAEFVSFLEQASNVALHGPVPPKQLAREFMKMDAFLICYDIEKDQSKGTNYHKVMEYLSSGRVVISSNITTYAALPGLIEMNASRTDNHDLPALFKKVIADLPHYNSDAMLNLRRNFALSNLYNRKITEVEKLLHTA